MKKPIKNALKVVFFAIWGLMAFFINNQYITHVIFLTVVYAILSSSLNLAVGITGLSSMSHAAFFSVGAYAAAITATRMGAPFYVTLILGGLLSMLSGVILGVPTLRLKGFYLALVTIGFGQIVRIIELNWISVTKGPMGIPGIPTAHIGSFRFNVDVYIIYAILVLLLTLLVTKNLLNSKIGRALRAISSDDVVAKSLGVNTNYYKVLAFGLSAFFAGMAGSIYAHYVTFVSPDTFTSSDSNTILCMVILGGSSSLLGPILSAILLVILPEVMRFAEMWRTVFVGVVMIFAIIAKEINLWGKIGAWFSSFNREKAIAGGEN